MPVTHTMIAVRVSDDLLTQIDTDARRLGLSRSALVRARMEQADELDAAAVLQAAEQLRGVLDQIDQGSLGATPLASPHLRGAVDALETVAAT